MVVLPLAALLGFLIATPDDLISVGVVGLVVMALSLPAVLRWHHAMLIFSLNAALVLAFLPGSPAAWMPMALASGGLTLLGRIMEKNRRLLDVPSITWPLLAFAVVVIITARMTGGLGMRALGSGMYGGKKYFYVWLSVVVYFALSWVRIQPSQAGAWVGGYLLSGLSSVFSNLIYLAGPAAYFLYAFVPVDMAMHQIVEDFNSGPGGEKFNRLGGVAVASYFLVPYFLMRFGARGVLQLNRPWRMALLVAALMIGALGGFRSTIAFAALLFVIHFFVEGLHRTRLFPILLVTGALGFLALYPLAIHLPLSVQRSLSILPIPVSPMARFDAEQSSQWRVDMWAMVTPEIPKYFWMGKGFTASSTDYYLTMEMVRRGMRTDQEMMILAGDYHNGPLSVLLPFGIWGVIAFTWFMLAGLRLLVRNYRYGDPSLRSVNTFLLCYYIAKVVFFLTVFGAVHLDLLAFVGTIGLSVSVNGGMRRAKDVAAPAAAPAAEPTDAPASLTA